MILQHFIKEIEKEDVELVKSKIPVEKDQPKKAEFIEKWVYETKRSLQQKNKKVSHIERKIRFFEIKSFQNAESYYRKVRKLVQTEEEKEFVNHNLYKLNLSLTEIKPFDDEFNIYSVSRGEKSKIDPVKNKFPKKASRFLTPLMMLTNPSTLSKPNSRNQPKRTTPKIPMINIARRRS